MKSRVAIMGIVVEDSEHVAELNAILHEYARHIIGRMGIPYRERGVNIISVTLPKTRYRRWPAKWETSTASA